MCHKVKSFCEKHIPVCWEGRGAVTVKSLKKINSTLVYFEIHNSKGVEMGALYSTLNQ